MTRRTCLFAHYDPRHRVARHVLHYLTELQRNGFSIHIALSGMQHLHEEDRDEIGRIGASVHFRPNAGLDFGAWQYLIRQGCADGADRILLANDSVFGPLQSLPQIFDAFEQCPSSVWGMVESRESCWHLQSWFLYFQAEAFAAGAVARVFQLPFQQMNKAEIVLHGELGLGAAIQAERLTWDARLRAPSHRLRRLVPGNPMHLDFMHAVRSGAVPFIKVELLRDNPARIPWVRQWRNLFDADTSFPVEWINRHLADGRRHDPPSQRLSPQMRLLYAAISRDQPEALLSLIARRPAVPAGTTERNMPSSSSD